MPRECYQFFPRGKPMKTQETYHACASVQEVAPIVAPRAMCWAVRSLAFFCPSFLYMAVEWHPSRNALFGVVYIMLFIYKLIIFHTCIRCCIFRTFGWPASILSVINGTYINSKHASICHSPGQMCQTDRVLGPGTQGLTFSESHFNNSPNLQGGRPGIRDI